MKPLALCLTLTILCLLALSGCNDRQTGSLPVSEETAVTAIRLSDTDSFRRYLENGYPVVGKDAQMKNSPAYWAIVYDRPEIMKLLIDHGLDVNLDWGASGGNLLTNATQFGHTRVLGVLLDAGALTGRDSKLGRTPLYSAIVYRQTEAEALLIKHGAKLNQWDRDALATLGIAPPAKATPAP